MNYSKFRITLDIHKHQSQVSIPVMYGDTAVQLFITLSDGGMPYTIGKSCWAQFVANKPGVDEPLTRVCLIEDGTTIRLDFDADITNVAGVHNCEIRLYGSEGILTSPCFTMVVDPRVVNDNVFDDMTANGYFDQIGLAMASFQRAEEAREEAEQGRVVAEEERVAKFGELETDVGESYKDVNLEDKRLTFEAHDGSTKEIDLSSFALERDVKPTLESLSMKDSELQKTDENLERRVSNIEQHISDDYFVTDNTVSYKKAVPARACSTAKLLSMGGMTYRDEETQTLRDSKVTEIVSEGVNRLNPSAYASLIKDLTFTLLDEGSFSLINKTALTSSGTRFVAFEIPIPEAADNLYFKAKTELIGGLTRVNVFVRIINSEGNYFYNTGWETIGDITQTLNVKRYLNGEAGTLRLNFYGVVGEPCNVGDGAIYRNVMVSFDTDMPYTPYKEPISYPIPAEIQTGKGVEGYADTIDFENKKDIQQIVGVDLGDFNWDKPATNVFMSSTKPSNIKYIDNNTSLCVCANYPNYSYSELYSNRAVEGFKGIGIDGAGNIRIVDGAYADVASLKEAVKGVIAYIVLETPIETDISEHLKDFDNLIEIEGGGSLEFVNEYEQAVPSAVKYLLKEDSTV